MGNQVSSLLTLRPGPLPWEVDAVPYVYSEAGRAQFKAMPGIRWVADRSSPNGRGFYRGPRDAVEIVAAVLESAGVCKVRTQGPSLAGPADTCTHPTFHWHDCSREFVKPAGLRPYQLDGISWLRWQLQHSGAALLADDMGLGKSAQTIVALESLPDHGEVAVICPAVVRPHWEAQRTRWGSGERRWNVWSYEGFTRARKRGEIPICSALVVDELHYCSNPRAGRTAAVREWLASQSPRPLVVGLSGTPMTARPRDLWQPLDLLHPGRWGTKWLFERRYCDGRFEEIEIGGGEKRNVWKGDGCSRADELGNRLHSVMLRRTKRDVGAELPPLNRISQEVEISASARKSLQRAAAAIGAKARGSWGSSASELLSESESHKLEAATELAREALEAGHRVLLVTTRKATAAMLASELGAPHVTGDNEIATRRALIAEVPCAVATMYSITTGIDLVGFDVIVFVGLDWVPSTLLQVESRLHRLGQERAVTAYYLCALGTLDEVVRERVIERLDQFASIVGSGDGEGLRGALAGGSDEDLIAAMVAAVTKGNK
jgi:SNF2 family DNA or RNA helicase